MKRWTKIEENVLRKAVADNHGNLTVAFMAASYIVERTPKACNQHWYYMTKKDPKKVTFGTVSKTKYSVNRKNTVSRLPKNSKEHASLWKKLLSIFK